MIFDVKSIESENKAMENGDSIKWFINLITQTIFSVDNKDDVVENKSNNEKKSSISTNIDIWVTNDNGKYVGKSSNLADNVIFNNKTISAESISIIPDKKYVGNVLLS
jgi:hypothetical protein